jgi:apolipoprotein N-acyltransferase
MSYGKKSFRPLFITIGIIELLVAIVVGIVFYAHASAYSTFWTAFNVGFVVIMILGGLSALLVGEEKYLTAHFLIHTGIGILSIAWFIIGVSMDNPTDIGVIYLVLVYLASGVGIIVLSLVSWGRARETRPLTRGESDVVPSPADGCHPFTFTASEPL